MNTNLHDLAYRMAGRAEAEGRRVEDEIAKAHGTHVAADVVKANADRQAVAGLSFGDALRFLMRNGLAAPVNSSAPVTAPRPQPLTKSAPIVVQPLRKAAVDALRAEIGLARQQVRSPQSIARLDELAANLHNLVAFRGVR